MSHKGKWVCKNCGQKQFITTKQIRENNFRKCTNCGNQPTKKDILKIKRDIKYKQTQSIKRQVLKKLE